MKMTNFFPTHRNNVIEKKKYIKPTLKIITDPENYSENSINLREVFDHK